MKRMMIGEDDLDHLVERAAVEGVVDCVSRDKVVQACKEGV